MHSDYYRFRGAVPKRVHVCWIPLMAQDQTNGCVVHCLRSHLLPDYDEVSEELEELPAEFERQVAESEWGHAEYELGDVAVFDIRTIHASFKNKKDFFRISVDTRWVMQHPL